MNLNFRNWPGATVDPARFPRGSFTVNSRGEIVVSTLPRTFSANKMDSIARLILSALASARALGTPFTEMCACYAGLEIRARDLSGGAIIFITPQEF